MTFNTTFELVLEATDADGDNLTFDVPDKPPGASFSQSGNKLFFSWHVNSSEEVEPYILAKKKLTPSLTGYHNLVLSIN